MSQDTTTMTTTSEHRDAALQSASSIEVSALPHQQQQSQQLNDDDTDNNEEKEQDENDNNKEVEITSHSLLDNDSNTINTTTTTTMICKPQSNQFVNEMQFNFASIKSLLLTGRIDNSSSSEDNYGQELLCTPGRPTTLATEAVAKDVEAVAEEEKISEDDSSSVSKATNLIEECKEEEKEDEGSGNIDDTQSISSRHDPISLLFMLYNYISIHLLDLFGSTTRIKKNNNKSSNQLRMEERIRRELALEKKKVVDEQDEHTSVSIPKEEAATTSVPKDTTNTITTAKDDESFLPSSLVESTKMISGKVHQEIQLIIQVDDIKFTHHPELSSSSTVKEEMPTNNDIDRQRYDEECQTTHVESKEEEDADIETPNQITNDDKLRQQRRITSERYFVRLIINNKVVGDTKAKQLDKSTFIVKLSHNFNCKLTSHKPTSVCLQIWKKSSIGFSFFLPDCLISTCCVPIEEQDEKEEDGLSLNVQFSSSSTSSDESGLQQGLKGTLSVTSSCQVHSVQSGPATCKALPQQLPSTSMFRQSLIRPPVVNNENGSTDQNINNKEKTTSNNLYHSHQSTTMEFKDPNSGIPFSNTSLIEEPLRHVLIKQRQRNPSSVPLSIPITEREVQNSDVYRDLIRNEQEILNGNTANSIMQYDRISSRVKQQHFFEVYNGIKEYTQQTRRKKHHQSDIIQDVGLSRFFVNNEQFQLPIPSRTRQVSTMANDNGSISLLLTIVGGKNVPIQLDVGRSSSQHLIPSNNHDSGEPQLNEPANDKDNEEDEERYLGVLVKIKFRGKTYQTKVVINSGGSMGPQWMETICLPLNDILDEEGGNLSISNEDEVVDLSLFDCTAIDLRRMGGFYDDEDTRSTELRYLGHVSLPLSIILRQGSMNGLVPCHSPDVIVGYDKSKSSSSDQHQESSTTTTLFRIHATTQPLTIIPPRACLDFPSVESEKLLARVEKWSLLNNGYDNTDNHCQVLWPDSRGNTHLVSRFLTEHHSPPHGFDSVASCAHYVSLLPLFRRRDWKALEERDERTVLTSQQCLNILAGTPQEHAILLANFFLYLNKKRPVDFAADVNLVVGFSIPEGKTAWVMRQSKSSNEVVLWNAMTGVSYSQTDTCPLQKIYYLASMDNIYSNVERGKKPSQLNFDLSNRRKWTPLHRGKILDTITRLTVQDESLHFSLSDHQYARELQNEISESLQNAIRSARRVATSFRSDVGTMIGNTIEKLEVMKMSGQQVSSNSLTTDIVLPESITNTRTVFGFTLHVPFTSIQDVLDRIEATEIHCNMNPRIEFGIAVRCFAYPGGVMSLWVFVCSLTPKR